MGDGFSYSSLKSDSFSFFFLWVEKKVVGVNEGAHVFLKLGKQVVPVNHNGNKRGQEMKEKVKEVNRHP